jgi:hypothetical protein
MPCNCGGKKPATPENPYIFGDPVGDPVQVKATIAIAGVKAGETTWVKGTHVDRMLEAGWIQSV